MNNPFASTLGGMTTASAPAGAGAANPFAGFAPPTPPDAPDSEAQIALAADVGDEDLKDVQKPGDLIPAGTYHVRIVKCEVRNGKNPAGSFSPQPMFAIQFAIQEEPYVGRRLFDNILWITADLKAAANDNTNPYCAEARKIMANRLGRWKAIKEDAFGLKGNVQPLSILGDETRELKIVVAQTRRREKNEATGNWEATDVLENTITKYLPLRG